MAVSSRLLLLFVFATAGCDSEDDPMSSASGSAGESDGEPTPLSVNEGGDTVLVPDDWKACSSVADCVQVGTSCDFCCGLEAIDADLADLYDEQRDPLCEPYDGGVCDCAPIESEMQCVDQLCTLVPV